MTIDVGDTLVLSSGVGNAQRVDQLVDQLLLGTALLQYRT